MHQGFYSLTSNSSERNKKRTCVETRWFKLCAKRSNIRHTEVVQDTASRNSYRGLTISFDTFYAYVQKGSGKRMSKAYCVPYRYCTWNWLSQTHVLFAVGLPCRLCWLKWKRLSQRVLSVEQSSFLSSFSYLTPLLCFLWHDDFWAEEEEGGGGGGGRIWVTEIFFKVLGRGEVANRLSKP